MKPNIHPTYYPNAKISCACGNSTTVGSTVEEIHVEICSHCHPFYTGKQKLVDTARRVEKFVARKAKAIREPKPKTGRVRKLRTEPLKPLDKHFGKKTKTKPVGVRDKKVSSKPTGDKPSK